MSNFPELSGNFTRYNKAYSQHRHIDTQREILRPLKRDPDPLRYKPLKFEESVTRSSWIPYYSNQTKRIYSDEVEWIME